jgi:hypothetical protein
VCICIYIYMEALLINVDPTLTLIFRIIALFMNISMSLVSLVKDTICKCFLFWDLMSDELCVRILVRTALRFTFEGSD